jgi:hypothetical protein
MSTDIDVEEIKTIAEDLASREEFILSKQQWRSKLDRERGFAEVNVTHLVLITRDILLTSFHLCP